MTQSSRNNLNVQKPSQEECTDITLSPELSEYWDRAFKKYRVHKSYDHLLLGNFHQANIKWFAGAKLNITENCLDRHLEKNGLKTALIFEPNHESEAAQTFTYNQLHLAVCRFAELLKKMGVKKGDVVCFYMGMTPELMMGVLACARIGAVHSVVFGGFSPQSLRGRIDDCKPRLLITHDGAFRGDKIIPLKLMADEALSLKTDCALSVEKVLVVKRTMEKIPMQDHRDYFYDVLIKDMPIFSKAESCDAEDPLFILYTSGSTGKPKGLMHTTAGYMVHAGESFRQVFDLKEDDIFWCTADLGWITGHTYLTYAPLLNGVTTVMYEGIPTYPMPDRFWKIIEKHKITILYTAPTAIRALEKFGHDIPAAFSMPSLRVLGSVGEPINEEAWDWYHEFVGKNRCPIVDTWWQTETGGIMISPKAFVTKLKKAHATQPLDGIVPVLLTEKGELIKEIEATGLLCINTPWPSMARTIWGDHSRFIETYFKTYPGYYFTGDGAKRDRDGDYRITGRVDDVINVSGHRIGTAEVEDAINLHPDITESAVIGYPHDIKGQGIYAFAITKIPLEELKNDELKNKIMAEIKAVVQKAIGPIAKPDEIILTDALPKTRSGKIMRRILRKIVEKELNQLGDTSTLLNPECVETIIQLVEKNRSP